jgi:hypothetical protein
MTNHFSELGSIIFSKSCDYYNLNPISTDDINMYYSVLTEEDIQLPEKVSKNNHIACCLYYLTKQNEKYKETFIEKYFQNLSFNNIKIDQENLILIFNIIEFDKAFLKSGKDHLQFLYKLLRSFSNFPTNFESFIIYKYYRGYLKFKIGEYESTNKEYFEIISEISEQKDEITFLLKYIKIKNSLLKLQLFNKVKKKSTKADYSEYWQFLRELFEEVKKVE